MLSVSALLLVLMFAGVGGASAETYAGVGLDEIEGGYDWDEDGSPYIVNETIFVEAGETLTIGPGVKVLFDQGCRMVVDGTLIVEGNATHPVVFDTNETSSLWYGILLNENSTAVIDRAIFNNATAAIEAYDCDVTITNSRFVSLWALAPIYADFEEKGSITVDGCYIEANSVDPEEGAISIFASAWANGEYTNVTEICITITDNVIKSACDHCTIYVGMDAFAVDNATASIIGDILISGNTVNEDALSSDLIAFQVEVVANDNATASIGANVTIIDNELSTTGTEGDGMVRVYRDVTVNDNATASLLGIIVISGNSFDQASSSLDFINIKTDVRAEENGTAELVGDITIIDNEMMGTGDAMAQVLTEVMTGDNATVRIEGDTSVSKNHAEDPSYGILVDRMFNARGCSHVSAVGNLYIDDNDLGDLDPSGFVVINILIAVDDSTMSVIGDVHMSGNDLHSALNGFITIWQCITYNNATLNVESVQTIEDNHITETYVAIVFQMMSSTDQDGSLSLQIDLNILNNVVDQAYQAVLFAPIVANAGGRSCISMEASLHFDCNRFNYTGVDMRHAVFIDRVVNANDEGVCAMDVEVCITGNEAQLEAFNALYIGDFADAKDNATATLLGDVTIADNVFTMGMMPVESEGESTWIAVERKHGLNANSTIIISSNIIVECNEFRGSAEHGVFMRVDVRNDSVENATLDYCGDLVVRDNNFEHCYGNAVRYVVNLDAPSYVEIDYDGAVIIEGNTVKNAEGLAFFIRQRLASSDFGLMAANFPVCIDGNIVEIAEGMVRVLAIVNSTDESQLTLAGEVCIENNECYDLTSFSAYYDAEFVAKNNSTMLVNVPVKISENIGCDIQVDRDIDAYDNATVDATIPTCVQYNTVTGKIEVWHVLDAMQGNATVMATGDVLILRNMVTYDPIDGSSDGINVWINVRAACDGRQQGCEAIYDADVVITENEVSANLEDSNTVYGIDVYVSVYAGDYGSFSGPCEGSSSNAAFGDVLVTKNMVTMYGASGANLWGVYVDPDCRSYAHPGQRSCATIGKVIVECNEVLLAGDDSVGISFYGEYQYASAEGEGSEAITLAGVQTIRGNLVDIEGNDSWAICVFVNSLAGAKAYDGGRAEARTTSGMIVSDNDVFMNGRGNSGILLDSYQESKGVGGEACFERAFSMFDNRIEITGSTSYAINVVRFANAIYYTDGDADLVGPLTIGSNDIVMIGSGSLFAPAAPGDNGLSGIYVYADALIDPLSSNGTGSLAAEVCIIDNTIEGAEYGIYLSNVDGCIIIVMDNVVTETLRGVFITSCKGIEFRGNTFEASEYGLYVTNGEGIVIDGNAFLENDCGVHLLNDRNTTVRDNFFSKNVVGLNASGSRGLVVEDCYFQRNGDGAKLDAVGGVVGNNTFYMNERNGLGVVGGVLAIYNGEYDQNDLGLSVVGGSVDWFVDARAVVHANGVRFAGEIVITGTLVLDYAGLELRPDSDVVHGIYAGYARLVVAENGCLEAYNSVIGGEHSTLWFFDVYGKMSMTNCYMTDMYEVYLGKSSKVEMTTTTIDDAHGNGIRIVGCSPVIRGCTITGSSMDGIYVADGAKPIIVGCMITGSDRGIYAFEACLDMVVDNVIVMNEYGVYAERVTGTVHDNVMMLNGVELFMLECDVVVANNQFGYGRLIEMNEALASALLQAIDELVDVNLEIRVGLKDTGPEPGFGLDAIIAELSLSSLNGRVGMYAIDSSIEANGNEYGWLQTALYSMRSDIVFSDVIRTNTFDMTYANGTRTLSIPFTVYDGIYAVDSTLTIRDASIQAVDDAIFLENSRALILDTSFDAGDYDLYVFRDSEAAVCGSLDKYAVLDESRLYWLAELTVSVVDQDGWGIGGASVVVKDSNGRVWSEGMTAKSGVLVAHAPYALETRSGVNDSLGRCVVSASFGDQASTEAEVDVDGDEAVTLKMTMKKNSLFGMSPLVLGIVALVIVAVIVGAVMLARRK